MKRTDDPHDDCNITPPPIQTILTPEWYDAKERYAPQIKASLQAGRILMARTEAARQQEREAEQQAQELIRAQYRRERDRLLRVIRFDPQAFVKALGSGEVLTDAQKGGRP